jgi:hypothetical protein
MRNWWNTIPLIATMLVASVACDDKKTDAKDEDKAEKKKDEPEKSSQKDDEPEAEKEKAKEEKAEEKPAEKVAKAEVEEIDVNSLLEAAEDASGVLAADDLQGIDTSRAPVLAAPPQQAAQLAQVEWLPLPGDKLEIPYPAGWLKKKNGNVGVIASPDQKATIIFTTVTDMQQVGKTLDELGKAIGVKDVHWKEPKQVAFGRDKLGALVRGGELTTAKGDKAKVLFAIVETGGPEKVLAIAVKDATASPEIDQTGQAVLLSIRRKQ